MNDFMMLIRSFLGGVIQVLVIVVLWQVSEMLSGRKPLRVTVSGTTNVIVKPTLSEEPMDVR